MRLDERTLTEGDLLPALDLYAVDDAGAAVNLTGGTAVFLMATLPDSIDKDSENVIDAAADIVDAVSGHLRYQWASGDTDERGKYVGAFEVTITATNRKYTFPREDRILITILASIAS